MVFEPDVAQTTWSILNDLYVLLPLFFTSASLVLIHRLLSPVYTIHPPHVLACAAILLTTRLLRIPLPKDWYALVDVEWDDIWGTACWAMRLWKDWGIGPVLGSLDMGPGGHVGGDREKEENRDKENRWRRAWVLGQGKRAVRRWIEERK